MTDCIVEIELGRPTTIGSHGTVAGFLLWEPTARRHVEVGGDWVELPVPFQVNLGEAFDDGAGTTHAATPSKAYAKAAQTGSDWVWKVTEHVGNGVTVRYVAVPGDPTAKYGDLIDVDPDTLDPLSVLTPVWKSFVAAELAAYQPGLETGYAERVTQATSTQVAANASGVISGLSVTVLGKGRAVDVRFACPAVWAATANKQILVTLGVNGTFGGVTGVRYSPVTTFGPSVEFTRRLVLTDGVSYTFTVALYGEATSGTVAAFASATFPTTLSVTNR